MNELRNNMERIHTTEMGRKRIRRNLGLVDEDVVAWCKKRIMDEQADIFRKGKNWYINIEETQITVNAHSYTIITAHTIKKKFITR